ncbi:hypothetical protein PHMEG_00029307 [Phytophthora megakarya]|uniref:MULE transposase domain-containing protein n=1 Tax=Phytophthora megakarya TaxID=4795 RepID=A0A225V5I6_9STRA|nr:hypothetical protein PHMEG_00029307 [Phytophthora megakarya]
MRTVYTECASSRCKASRVTCSCRYKIVTCDESYAAAIFVEGIHTMLDSSIKSPCKPHLSNEMKQFVDAKLCEDSTIYPFVLFSFICEKVKDAVFRGPEPTQEQVQSYIKRWKQKNRDDSIQPVIDFCRSFMYDTPTNQFRDSGDLLIFCDVEDDPDNEGCYFPVIVYSKTIYESSVTRQQQLYSMLTRRSEDIAWCFRFIKRVLRERYATHFTPTFVMTDADDAQYNASADEFPSSTVLMCWFHVSNNIKEKTRKLPRITREMIFRDFNSLHFTLSITEYRLKKDRILNSWNSYYPDFPWFKKVAQGLVSQWIQCKDSLTDNIAESRFSRWQMFYSPPGYAVTNNPVEQYHKTLKIVNNSARATPIELLHRLDRCRIAFESRHIKFIKIPQVSARLRALYNRLDKKGAIKARKMPLVGDLQLSTVILSFMILSPLCRLNLPTHFECYGMGCLVKDGSSIPSLELASVASISSLACGYM